MISIVITIERTEMSKTSHNPIEYVNNEIMKSSLTPSFPRNCIVGFWLVLFYKQKKEN